MGPDAGAPRVHSTCSVSLVSDQDARPFLQRMGVGVGDSDVWEELCVRMSVYICIVCQCM